VETALRRMREVFNKPFEEIPENSLLKMVADREYLKEPVQKLVNDICQRLRKAIPIAFPAKNLPKSENDLNDTVAAFLDSYKSEFEKEYPAVLFAGARTIPDMLTASMTCWLKLSLLVAQLLRVRFRTVSPPI